MPTYEYECEKCKDRFEVFQNMTAEPLKKCLKCNGRLRRLIGGGSGIIFKGSGFYATDYRKQKKPDTNSCPLNKKDTSCKNCPKEKPVNPKTG